MKKEPMTVKLFSFLCENQRGLLSRLLQTFERAGHCPDTVSQYRTDIRGLVLVMLEVAVPGEEVDHYLRRCGKVIGVIDAVVSFGDLGRIAYFSLDREMLGQGVLSRLGACGARLIWISGNGLLVEKSGTLSEIERFQWRLDGKGLIGACHIPIPVQGALSLGDGDC